MVAKDLEFEIDCRFGPFGIQAVQFGIEQQISRRDKLLAQNELWVDFFGHGLEGDTPVQTGTKHVDVRLESDRVEGPMLGSVVVQVNRGGGLLGDEVGSHAEVDELYEVILVEEDVLALEVAVSDASAVQEYQAIADLQDPLVDELLAKERRLAFAAQFCLLVDASRQAAALLVLGQNVEFAVDQSV